MRVAQRCPFQLGQTKVSLDIAKYHQVVEKDKMATHFKRVGKNIASKYKQQW